MFRQGPFLSAPSSPAMWAESDNPNVAQHAGNETSFLDDGLYGSARVDRPMMQTASKMHKQNCAQQLEALENEYQRTAMQYGQPVTGQPNPSNTPSYNILMGIRSKQMSLQKKMKSSKEHDEMVLIPVILAYLV